MSDYDAIEALVLTRVRALSQFDNDNTSRGDWSILNNGKAEQYAILKPGAHSHTWISIGNTRQHRYMTIIELWQWYGHQDGSALLSLESLESTVRDSLDTYRLLADTTGNVRDFDIIETREVLMIPPGGPQWLMVALVGETYDEETITFAE